MTINQVSSASSLKGNKWSLTRSVVRRAWNTDNITNTGASQTPMRLAWNSGDPMLREGYVCGGGTQANASTPGTGRLIGGIVNTSDCDLNAAAPSYANNKWVYDGTDRVRYLRERATNKYYKKTVDANNSSQSTNHVSDATSNSTVATALYRVR